MGSDSVILYVPPDLIVMSSVCSSSVIGVICSSSTWLLVIDPYKTASTMQVHTNTITTDTIMMMVRAENMGLISTRSSVVFSSSGSGGGETGRSGGNDITNVFDCTDRIERCSESRVTGFFPMSADGLLIEGGPCLLRCACMASWEIVRNIAEL